MEASWDPEFHAGANSFNIKDLKVSGSTFSFKGEVLTRIASPKGMPCPPAVKPKTRKVINTGVILYFFMINIVYSRFNKSLYMFFSSHILSFAR
jgi:hypothetical protein